jgi:hypothetical protein
VRREWRSEEFRLREQQWLSSPGTSEYSSSGEEEEEESDGVGLPLRGGSLRPPRQSRGGDGRDGAWGGRGSTSRRASYGRGDARRGGAGARGRDDWGRSGGCAGGGYSACCAPEEEETRVFHPEVGDCFPLAASFRSGRI